MKGLHKNTKVIEISHLGEILIWLIVVLIFVAISSSTLMYKSHHDDDYQVFLQDVDGLIIGSPVRMMGIEVGHVTKIKPTTDEVYVNFILTNKDVYIPRGTAATVEFTGLAGSKSLELYLPDKGAVLDNSTPLILIQEPKRLHDAFDLLNQMYKKLNSIIYSVSSFGRKVDFDFKESNNLKKQNFNDFVRFSEKFVKESGDKINSIDTVVKEVTHAK